MRIRKPKNPEKVNLKKMMKSILKENIIIDKIIQIHWSKMRQKFTI
jgi:hypothetical protein